ncbi:MAG TPA: TatD family hydrolase [Thermomicrobiaceae bacterium]|nr:TatD family hydrolase [Thermomicrobiaceae bacterium]
MRLIDTHCHPDLDAFDADRPEAIVRAREAGVERFIVIGFEPERWESGRRLAATVPGAFLAVGLHPTEAARYDDDLEERLRRFAVESGAVGIGETGIDYHWPGAAPEVQRHAFARQIELARALDLPFIVHQREAAADVLAVVRQVGAPLRGVMHCFTEGPEYAAECIELGLHIGLGGAVTFKNARAVHEAARMLPLERLLLETDAPFMAPAPFRGKRNEPAYLALVLERVAELRGEDPATIAEATTANAERLFALAERSR